MAQSAQQPDPAATRVIARTAAGGDRSSAAAAQALVRADAMAAFLRRSQLAPIRRLP